jgi:hypothetical protein
MKKFIVLIVLVVVAILLAKVVKNQEENTVTNNPPNSAENAPEGSIHNLPVPQAVTNARAALATRLSIPESQILTLEAFETTWPDACLGIQEKDMGCAQMLTPGYSILLQANGKEYRYRTNLEGTVVKAEK